MLIETICGIDPAHIAFPDASAAYPILLQAPRSGRAVCGRYSETRIVRV